MSKEQLDFGVWRIIGGFEICVDNEMFPNEEYRKADWVGAKIYDASLVEDFLNAYHKIIPWDDWADPNYLDKFLLDLDKKPKDLWLIKKPK